VYQKEATKETVFAVEQEPSCKESRVKRVKSERTARQPGPVQPGQGVKDHTPSLLRMRAVKKEDD
jgi:hypothetical protein